MGNKKGLGAHLKGERSGGMEAWSIGGKGFVFFSSRSLLPDSPIRRFTVSFFLLSPLLPDSPIPRFSLSFFSLSPISCILKKLAYIVNVIHNIS